MHKNKINLIIKSFFVLFVYSLIYLFAYSVPVKAQEVSLSISPPLTEITIQPGKTFSQTFTVKNDGAPVIIVPKIFPFVPLDNQGHAELIEDKTTIDAYQGWFSFDQNPYALGTNGSHDFSLTMSPPDWAEEKDYYFTFLVETQTDDNTGVTSTLSQTRIGANILMNVSKDGNPVKKASIVEFSAPKIIDSFTPFTYKVLIGNPGASYFKPTGKITIDQIFGSTTNLDLVPLNVLVSGKREVSCLKGEEIIPCKLSGKFLIGVYRANLSFTVDGSGETIEKQTYTFAFPFTITLGLIMIFITYRIIKRLFKYNK